MQKDHLDVAKCPAGLKERVDKVIELLEMESNTNVVTVGIRGMGGVGKTTLAKAVYNNLRHKFEKACFISDVRHRAAPDNKGLPELQRQVLWDLIKYDVKVNDVSQGKNLMRDCLSSQIELVILDDVDHIHQLDALRGGSFGDDVDHIHQLDALRGGWFGAGSKIIVTTRELHVLNVGRIDRLYEPPALESDEALRLFSWHAFLRANPSGKLYHLSEKIVEACGGLPLSLEVMGAYLYDKQDDERLWHEALTKLGRAMYKDIQGNLRISYEGLNREEREMFLDIACFFIGIERETALSIWESQGMCPATAVTDLVLKSLIKLSSDDRLTMHDQLRDMGRAIVVEEVDQIVSRTRLWVAKEVKEALKATGSRLEFLPSDLKLKRLVVLDLEGSQLKQLWKEKSHPKMPKDLQVLKMNWCNMLETLPDFTNHLSLMKLELKGCERLPCLPDSIGVLKRLKSLDLGWCRELRELPECIANLHALETLNLKYCNSLTRLPKALGDLSALKDLEADFTKITELPTSLGNLSRLERMSVGSCSALGAVPASVGKLKQLKFFNAEECENLTCLGEEFGQLTQLEELNLSGFPPSFSALKSLIVMDAGEVPLSEDGLPSDIGKLASLEVLRLDFTELRTLSAEFSHLSRLTQLYLNNCRFLSELSCLPAELVEVDIRNCRNLRKISGMSNLKQLEILWLNSCEQLTHLPGLRSLHALAKLNISGCESLRNEALEGLEALKSLQELHFSGCGVLKVDFLKWIKGMPLLRELSFYASEIPEWFDHRMKTKFFVKDFPRLCMDRVSMIFDEGRYAGTDVGYMKATIVRGGQEVFETVFIRIREANRRDQLYLSMYLENDSFVKRLHSGDRIRIRVCSQSISHQICVKQGGMHLLYTKEETTTSNNKKDLNDTVFERLSKDLTWLHWWNVVWDKHVPIHQMDIKSFIAYDLQSCFIHRQTATLKPSVMHASREVVDVKPRMDEWYEVDGEYKADVEDENHNREEAAIVHKLARDILRP
eukprot:Gb_06500 [translate_table: standard]